jgi:hypothetical protein
MIAGSKLIVGVAVQTVHSPPRVGLSFFPQLLELLLSITFEVAIGHSILYPQSLLGAYRDHVW